MKTILLAAGLAVLGAGYATDASAGILERACIKSDRKGANRAMCGCIQQAADLTLTRSDQRTAARFFRDPQKAQDMRMSKSTRDNSFWKKYKNFGATAEAYCSFG